MEEEKILTEKSINKIFLGLLLVFLILIAPLVYFLANLLLGFWGFKNAESALKNGNFKTAQKNIFVIRGAVSRSKNFFQITQPVFVLLGWGETFEKGEKIFFLTEVLAAGADQALTATMEGNHILRGFLKGEEIDSTTSLEKIKVDLNGALEKVSLAQGFLESITGQEPVVGFPLLEIKRELPGWRLLLTQAQEGISVLDKILGDRQRQTYLLLFQNNMELRPTGGFIGSYGLLTLEGGKFLDFEVQDVYWADGQLRGYVEPPPKLKEFLGTASWYLRDSNWDPDFPTSANRAAWFLEKEIGRQTNGVIGIDLFATQRILEVFGEIELADYQEKVNANNFFEKAQFHIEVGFFPGSTAKRDFLGAVSLALFDKLRHANEKELAKITFSLFQSLAQKDILIYLLEESSIKTLSKLGWDGGIRIVKCQVPALPAGRQSAKCFGDYLMIVEANVGINKANYFLERSLELRTQISEDGQVEKKLTIFYENKSPSEIFPAGKYKNYLRVYVPGGSQLEKCEIESNECLVEQTIENQKQTFGFLVEVPVGEKRKVEISWQLPESFSEGQYLFLWQKQPGTKNEGAALALFYPPTLKIFPKTPGGLTGEQVLFYNMALTGDLVFEIDFYRN